MKARDKNNAKAPMRELFIMPLVNLCGADSKP